MKMLDRKACWQWLSQFSTSQSILEAKRIFDQRTLLDAHGDMAKWREALDELPEPRNCTLEGRASISIQGTTAVSAQRLTATLLKLHPWRKGPWNYFGVEIDTEWRSDWKWERVANAIEFAGKRILDVGCGNGYYGWRMLAAGAQAVLGCDPTLLYLMQFEASKRFAAESKHWILPMTDQEIPSDWDFFDLVFSMGVLYHRTSPIDHLLKLKSCLTKGGRLVIETLIVDGPSTTVLCPVGRYAKMRNVWFIPSVAMLETWLQRTGFGEIELLDSRPTTLDEQRATNWMTFESLADFQDPTDDSKTIEGHPAPMRAVLTAVRKS